MRTRARISLAGLVLAVALAGGVAYATIPSEDGTIEGCYKKENGQLRVVSADEECGPSERSIQWNQQGAAGATGAQGIQGLNGDAGAVGSQGAKGDTGAVGPAGTNGTNGETGAACLPEILGCQGPKGDTGAAGAPGTDGTDGKDGAPGANGDACLPEIRGCQGPVGDTGATGPPGPQGQPGAKGEPGTVGTIDIQNLVASRTVQSNEWQQTANPYYWSATIQADCPTGYKILDGSAPTGEFGYATIGPAVLKADLSGITVSVQVGTNPIATPGALTIYSLKLRCIGVS